MKLLRIQPFKIFRTLMGGVVFGFFIYGIFVSVFSVDTLYILQSLDKGEKISQYVFAPGKSWILRLG